MSKMARESAGNFVGTWELQSYEVRSGTDDWVLAPPVLGGEPVGILVYDDKGNMAVQITTNPRSVETPANNPEIVNGYVAYYGRYEVDTEVGTVTHHRRNHINPEIGSLSVVRYFRFSDDVLTLTFAPERQQRLNWVRVR
jgi:catechol 1,2-dioxygenase